MAQENSIASARARLAAAHVNGGDPERIREARATLDMAMAERDIRRILAKPGIGDRAEARQRLAQIILGGESS